MTKTSTPLEAAGGSPVDRGVGRLEPEREERSMPNDLPQPLYCRYGVCSAHEPHMPWCTEYTAGELAAAKNTKG